MIRSRWTMRVVSSWQEGIAEVGHSAHGKGLVKVLASANDKTGVAHISLEDAKLLRLALGRVIREIERTPPKAPANGPLTSPSADQVEPAKRSHTKKSP